jgi:two-component system cell cycle response regulator CpdR
MFITGFAAVAIDAQKTEERSTKVLSKPFHLNDLVSQVETVLKAA